MISSADRVIAAPVDKAVLKSLAKGGSATFLVQLKGEADLGAIPTRGRRVDRTTAVFEAKRDFAGRSQAGLRQLLTTEKAKFAPFWIANVVQVTGDRALLTKIRNRPDVSRILSDNDNRIPRPPKGAKALDRVRTVEWNIAQVRADRVWSDFGDTGQGIVIASIDTGVEYTHPALVNSYRGTKGDGTFDHNYNWYDPSQVCGSPSLTPCDNAGHGTHTMGTLVGNDGGDNQIGVAPGARWISAKGCEDFFCSDSALLGSGQWVVAPTDLQGQNPRPDLAPNIVSNSWGDGADNPFYSTIVDTWVAAGIFPVFATGNDGESGCDTAGSPGDYVNSYAVGGYDSTGAIAPWSSRGPGAGTEIKPNITAPGVNVRSSVPGGGYEASSGTSMATPHVAGAVALAWSAAPALIGNIDATRLLLDQNAVDTPDSQCGGTDADNNVYGEGKLDAYALVLNSPRGPIGGLTGQITSAGEPLADALVSVAGPIQASDRSDADGRYHMPRLSVGDYTVTVTKFGYLTRTAQVTIVEGQTATVDVSIAAAPRHQVTGVVRQSDGVRVAGATVTVLGTPLPVVTTDASGRYTLSDVPEGQYDITADFGRWLEPLSKHVRVAADLRVDFVLPFKHDAFGYVAGPATPAFRDTAQELALSGDDSQVDVQLPFPMSFYGKTYRSAKVSTNGYLAFEGEALAYSNGAIPSTGSPNAAIYALWDDLLVDGSSSVRTGTSGSTPNREFTVEWRNVSFLADTGKRLNVQIVLTEMGRVTLQYSGIDPTDPVEQGAQVTVGLENAAGDIGLQYSYNEPVLSDETAVQFRVPGSGLIRGTVTDANDKAPVSGATVTAHSASVDRRTTTDASGFYQLQVPLGSYTISAQKAGYRTVRAPVVLGSETIVVKDFVLKAPRITVTPKALSVVVPAGEQRTRALTLRNTGTAPATWQTKETAGGTLASAAAVPAARRAAKAAAAGNPDARTSKALKRAAPKAATVSAGKAVSGRTAAAGDVLTSWPVNELNGAWGVGYDGSVWLSDYSSRVDAKYSIDGVFDRQVPATAGEWPADMALDTSRNDMCQVTVGGDNNIRCWNRADGETTATISGPWNQVSQRGLAYRADDDTFYIGGWNEGIIYHVKGRSYPDPGAVISQCVPSDWAISGLAWSPRGVLWQVGNSEQEQLNALNPDTCETVQSVPDPDPTAYSGAGLEIDEIGNLWLIAQNTSGGRNTAYLVDSGIPSYTDVPWLSENPSSGTLDPRQSQRVNIRIDASALAPGVYAATVFVVSDSPRQPAIGVPIKVVVPRYQNSLDSGADAQRTDQQGDTWHPDQPYSTGGFGYLGTSTARNTNEPITNTTDPWLYQTAREGAYEYRFDNVPNGTYRIDLDFAELDPIEPNSRVFDVVTERKIVLPGYDIISENGTLNAARESFTVKITDGQANVRLLVRQGNTLINGVRVTERPDVAVS